MSDKNFKSWVSRADVEAMIGVVVYNGSHRRCAVIAGGPIEKSRYVDLPEDIFDLAGTFIGLAFDGDLIHLEDLADMVRSMVRKFYGRLDLTVVAGYRADRTLAGFYVFADEVES